MKPWPQRNRVDPYGEIRAFALRGAWMGNRGCLHRDREIVRPWNGKRWIICALHFKGWVAPKWDPGRWTTLFFYDEALAFAAGHRPCALCRREEYLRYQSATGLQGADAIDARLHDERLDGRTKRLHVVSWRDVPIGAFVDIDNVPYVVRPDCLQRWTAERGYDLVQDRPNRGDARVLTPPTSLRAITNGYALHIAAHR